MTYHTHRPELHVTPEQGILVAPAGALLDDSLDGPPSWHIFHQYEPSLDEPARWAHQVSAELPFDWDICDDAIAPLPTEKKVRAGSVVGLVDGSVDLFFTSITPEGTSIHVAEIPDITETTEDVSDDALAVDPHVHRIGEVVGNQAGFEDFRSPCVVARWDEDTDPHPHVGWLMLAVCGPQTSPRLMVLDSQDRRQWNLRGPLEFNGTSGLEAVEQLVSPRIIRLQDEVDGKVYDVLLVTLEDQGIDISGYLVGELNGHTFHVVTPFTRLDFGHDFVRPRNTNIVVDPNGYRPDFSSGLLFGLMNGIGRFDDPTEHLSLQTEGWANCLSLPRITTLQDGLIYQTPASGLPKHIPTTHSACMCTVILDASQSLDDAVKVSLKDANGNIAATITHMGDLLELDRSMNPHHMGDHIAQAPFIGSDTDAVTIIVDGSTVEVFADGGAISMASRVYFNSPCTEFDIQVEGNATIEHSRELFPSKR